MGKYYKHPQYGSVFCNDAYATPPCRLAFPSLAKPKDPPPPQPGQQPGMPRYEATLLLPKESKVHTDFIKGLEVLIADMLVTFNAGRSAKISELLVVKDGDSNYWQTGDNVDKYPYFKGQNLLVARNTAKPAIVGPDLKPIEPEKLAGGTLVIAVIIPIIVATGVTYKMKVIQLVKDDGTRYAGGARSDDDYIKMLNSVVPADTSPQGNGKDEEAPAEVVKAVKTPPLKKVGKSSLADLV